MHIFVCITIQFPSSVYTIAIGSFFYVLFVPKAFIDTHAIDFSCNWQFLYALFVSTTFVCTFALDNF